MALFFSIAERFRQMNDTQLRVVFGAMFVVSLLANLIASNAGIVHHSEIVTDDCLWGVERRAGEYVLTVAEVASGGQAEQAGVRVGDRVISINNIPIPPVADSLPNGKVPPRVQYIDDYAQ